MDREKLLATLHDLTAEGVRVLATRRPPGRGSFGPDHVESSGFQKWGTSVIVCFTTAFGEGDHYVVQAKTLLGEAWNADDADRLLAVLKSAREAVVGEFTHVAGPSGPSDPFVALARVFDRFHTVAKQLRHRRNEKKQPRPTLDVRDEYDVQDLLHAVLRLFFDDVRPEDWTPNVGGSSKRMDFILWKECIAIETKMTRPGLTQTTLVDELIIDIRHYRTHGRAKVLVCFVYDPAEVIPNPEAVQSDLAEHTDGFKVMVFVRSR